MKVLEINIAMPCCSSAIVIISSAFNNMEPINKLKFALNIQFTLNKNLNNTIFANFLTKYFSRNFVTERHLVSSSRTKIYL